VGTTIVKEEVAGVEADGRMGPSPPPAGGAGLALWARQERRRPGSRWERGGEQDRVGYYGIFSYSLVFVPIDRTTLILGRREYLLFRF
jgi:hypothetical protein